jgi:hypothetical protein
VNRLQTLLIATVAGALMGVAGPGPQHHGRDPAPPAGFTIYTSHGAIVGGGAGHNWQTYDDKCDLPSEGCDPSHRVGIGG